MMIRRFLTRFSTLFCFISVTTLHADTELVCQKDNGYLYHITLHDTGNNKITGDVIAEGIFDASGYLEGYKTETFIYFTWYSKPLSSKYGYSVQTIMKMQINRYSGAYTSETYTSFNSANPSLAEEGKGICKANVQKQF